ncbi:hypothetical protein [Nonomuraea recticatena]|uniref:Uncharacterized protein n=1 Tax=Nonomuraea recticatena TaxID=46178 RepID=A0ABN3SX20_9ACTN
MRVGTASGAGLADEARIDASVGGARERAADTDTDHKELAAEEAARLRLDPNQPPT